MPDTGMIEYVGAECSRPLRAAPLSVARRPGMSEMEFSWRMVATLAWPLVVLAGLIVYRKWITETLTSLRFKFGSVEAATCGLISFRRLPNRPKQFNLSA